MADRTRGRASRHQRGYDSKWDRIRQQIIQRDNYLCQECLRNGTLTEVVVGDPSHPRAAHVDHIIPKVQGGTDDGSNLELLDRTCHERKTARENRSARPEVGEDGWPVTTPT